MSDLSFVEVFAGAGGLSLGLERAGWSCGLHVEINPHAQAVLRHHWPAVPLLSDVIAISGGRKMKRWLIKRFGGGRFRLISGGSPCQDLSAPMECERLQGVPDNCTLVTHNGKPSRSRVEELERALERATVVIRDVAWSGIEHDAGKYLTVQIDRETWAEAKAYLPRARASLGEAASRASEESWTCQCGHHRLAHFTDYGACGVCHCQAGKPDTSRASPEGEGQPRGRCSTGGTDER